MGISKTVGSLKKVKEEAVDIDYLPRGRPPRRRPIADEFDRECGYAYEHRLVFVRFTTNGAREYECGNCGERTYFDAYSCDADIHEMLEVGALEIAFQPRVTRSTDTLHEMAKDRHKMDAWHQRQKHKKNGKKRNDEEVDLDA